MQLSCSARHTAQYAGLMARVFAVATAIAQAEFLQAFSNTLHGVDASESAFLAEDAGKLELAKKAL